MSDTPRTDKKSVRFNSLFADKDQWWVPRETARDLERELNAANASISHITDGFRREQNDIEQSCGKALGYPRYCDDQANFPGATEADGVCVGDHVAASIAAELANKYAEAMERIKRLEEAGDAMASRIPDDHWEERDQAKWQQVKEAKP